MEYLNWIGDHGGLVLILLIVIGGVIEAIVSAARGK